MYKTSDFLERYKSLEKWAEAKYGDEGVKGLEQELHDKRVQSEVRYFRSVRNLLSHNPNGSQKPFIELTDEFKARFEALCDQLMSSISKVMIPYRKIYKCEMVDKVMPTISHMKEKVYTHVPVMNGKKVWGVFSESAIFDIVGDGNTSLINDNTTLLQIGKYITEYSSKGVFDFAGVNDSMDDIRRMFGEAVEENRRLDVIYITSTGNKNGDLVGLVTIWDLPAF